MIIIVHIVLKVDFFCFIILLKKNKGILNFLSNVEPIMYNLLYIIKYFYFILLEKRFDLTLLFCIKYCLLHMNCLPRTNN